MNKPQIVAMALLLACIAVNTCKAQDEQEDSTPPKKSYGEAKISYLSNSVFYGRKDSLPVHYITPQLGYYAKSGFFINGSVSWLQSSTENRIDVFTLQTGYNFTLNDHWDGSASFSKNFNNSSSYNVKSEVSSELNADLNYSSNVLNVFGGSNLNFGSKTDIGFNLGMSHNFEIGDFSIAPEATLNAATQNFYEAYYEKRRYAARRRKGNPNEVSVTVTSDVSHLKVLDYEFALPMHYYLNHFGLFATPTFVVPTNPNTLNIKINNVQRTYQERLSNSFFIEFGFSYRIGKSY